MFSGATLQFQGDVWGKVPLSKMDVCQGFTLSETLKSSHKAQMVRFPKVPHKGPTLKSCYKGVGPAWFQIQVPLLTVEVPHKMFPNN